jgi:cobalt-zinc-cadmium efflux system protein
MGHQHHHEPGHSHAHGGSVPALSWALGITLLFTVVEAVGGWMSGSLALLADAAHMLMDAGALGLALFAAWIVRRPPSPMRTYGWYRVEILAALVNGALLLAVTAGIVVEAVERLLHPSAIRADVMLVVASAGTVANIVSALVLHRSRGENLNMRGAYLHVVSDLLGSVAAIVAALIIRATGWLAADPLLSIALSVLLTVSSVRLLWQAVDVLLEAAPRHVDMVALQAAVAAVPGVERVHDLHVWTVASGLIAMSGHCVVPDLTQQDMALSEITARVKGFGIGHVTVQLERSESDCVGCEERQS